MFLPNGGHLGFGLIHRYPIDLADFTSDDVEHLLGNLQTWLKGGDAIVLKVCTAELELKASLKFVVEDSSYGTNYKEYVAYVLMDHAIDNRVDPGMPSAAASSSRPSHRPTGRSIQNCHRSRPSSCAGLCLQHVLTSSNVISLHTETNQARDVSMSTLHSLST